MRTSTDLHDAGLRRTAITVPAFPQTSADDARDGGSHAGRAADGPASDSSRARHIAGRIRRFIDGRGRATGLVLKWLVALAGLAVICAGVIMLVIPGPGILTILAGIGILGILSPRLERLLHEFIDWAQRAWEGLRARWARSRVRPDRVG